MVSEAPRVTPEQWKAALLGFAEHAQLHRESAVRRLSKLSLAELQFLRREMTELGKEPRFRVVAIHAHRAIERAESRNRERILLDVKSIVDGYKTDLFRQTLWLRCFDPALYGAAQTIQYKSQGNKTSYGTRPKKR